MYTGNFGRTRYMVLHHRYVRPLLVELRITTRRPAAVQGFILSDSVGKYIVVSTYCSPAVIPRSPEVKRPRSPLVLQGDLAECLDVTLYIAQTEGETVKGMHDCVFYGHIPALYQWRRFLVMSGGGEKCRGNEGVRMPFCLALILYFWLITSSACGWNIHLTQQKQITFKTPWGTIPQTPPAPPPPPGSPPVLYPPGVSRKAGSGPALSVSGWRLKAECRPLHGISEALVAVNAVADQYTYTSFNT